jgi:hypothetical protein
MSKVENYTQKAIDIANDNKYGYSQYNRWGNPDYDCSSLVITVVQNAGIPVKTNGATYTGNMYNAFIKSGFEDVTHTVNLTTGQGLKRGDVLLNIVNHTEIYIGNGKNVGARGSETGTIHGVGGDQTGQEIRVGNYYNYPWNKVLRYKETTPLSTNNSNGNALTDFAKDVLKGKYGNGDARKENIYKTVQNEVNAILNKGTLRNNYITIIAKDVINGKYGNGNARKENIYKAVQNEVNKLVK